MCRESGSVSPLELSTALRETQCPEKSPTKWQKVFSQSRIYKDTTVGTIFFENQNACLKSPRMHQSNLINLKNIKVSKKNFD